jgi:hypothetical protein
LRGSNLQVPALLLLLIMLLYADCMFAACAVTDRCCAVQNKRKLGVTGHLRAATCLHRRTVLLRDKIPSIENANSLTSLSIQQITSTAKL